MTPGRDRHRPERTCVQCGAKGEKEGFLRVARRPGGGFDPDPRGQAAGRGIYLCRETACIERFARRIRTAKGAARFRMGDAAAGLADRLDAWQTGRQRAASAGDPAEGMTAPRGK